MQKHYLSKRELAATMGVSARTVDNWLAARKIPKIALSPRLLRFDLDKVKAALNRYEVAEIGRKEGTK